MKELLDNYHAFHQNRSDQITHYISIPAIIIGSLILLSWITVSIATRWHITFSWIAIILALIYYYRLHVKLAIVMTVVLVILNLICTWIGYPKPTTFSLILFIILFFGGWILLLIGHTLEKNRPPFFSSLSQIMIAPMFLLIEAIRAMNMGKYFNLDSEPETLRTYNHNSRKDRDDHNSH
jgi:uncharacterized membrane protein YGL010W